MGRIHASLERLQALWKQLELTKPGSPEYKVIEQQIRAESKMYNKLAEASAAKKPPPG
jgi:hypothetical protein